uniref:Fatty acid-binding protein n=1 Tax=Meloidogyne javanica TaxID=6303 RepID=A0A915LBT2_MELJA
MDIETIIRGVDRPGPNPEKNENSLNLGFVLCTFTFVDGKLIEEQKKIKDDDKESHFERYIDADGKLVITCKSGNVEAVRKYEKI